MDTLNLSETHFARLDYFNARCMRRILNIPAAYISRFSKVKVFNRAARATHRKRYVFISETKSETDNSFFLGHIIRNHSDNDHAERSAINADGRRVTVFTTRIGRPRSKWLTPVTD